MKRSSFKYLAALLGMCACASTDYGTRTAGERPADLSSAEASFWYQMDEAETRLKVSGALEKDPDLNRYVKDTACLVTGDYCDEMRVYILKDPSFNAAMAPNGMMIINTGLLLRLENESQLATVLAHEFVHYQENHALEQYAAMKNSRAAGLGADLVLGVASGGILAGLGTLATVGNASSFSQEQEQEADRVGLEIMYEAGFNPHDAPLVWKNYLGELSVSENKEKKKRSSRERAGAFQSHPAIRERIEALEEITSELPVREINARLYRGTRRPFLKLWLDDQIVLKDYSATLQLIEHLSQSSEDLGTLNYALARIYLLRNDEEDQKLALAAARSAQDYEDMPAENLRLLGEIYRGNGDAQLARDAFVQYLEAAPDARDYALIESIVKNLGKD